MGESESQRCIHHPSFPSTIHTIHPYAICSIIKVNYVAAGSAGALAGVAVGQRVTAVNKASLPSLGIKGDAALAAYLKAQKRPLTIDFDFGATKVMDK